MAIAIIVPYTPIYKLLENNREKIKLLWQILGKLKKNFLAFIKKNVFFFSASDKKVYNCPDNM